MIDISPKALRFARLAAEQQPALAGNPEIAEIEVRERALGREPARRFVAIGEDTAFFCLRAVKALLANPKRFDGPDWDGNDFAFLQSVAQSLDEQLARTQAKAL